MSIVAASMHGQLTAIALSIASAALQGWGAVVARIGIRYTTARIGASISVPITTCGFWLLAPALLHVEHASLPAALWFGAVGVLFPASVTLLNFESARRLGPSIASALGASTALFSSLLAIALLHEQPTLAMLAGTLVIMAGVALIAVRRVEHGIVFARGWLLMPIAGAAIRAAAQTTVKHALSLWPSPFAASLLSYSVSTALLVSTRPPAPDAVAQDKQRAIGWFALAGLCNGGAVLAMYAALNAGPVSLVAPLATVSPLFAAIGSAVMLREEQFDRRLIGGVLLTVLGAALLVAR